MTTVSKGATTLTPLLVTGYSSSRAAGNIVHEILSRADPDITFAAARLRAGTLQFLCASHSQALTFEGFHAAPGVYTLADPDLPGVGMKYVTAGEIVLTLDSETLEQWLVDVPFQEVL